MTMRISEKCLISLVVYIISKSLMILKDEIRTNMCAPSMMRQAAVWPDIMEVMP